MEEYFQSERSAVLQSEALRVLSPGRRREPKPWVFSPKDWEFSAQGAGEAEALGSLDPPIAAV
jgi:hypothetical protein